MRHAEPVAAAVGGRGSLHDAGRDRGALPAPRTSRGMAGSCSSWCRRSPPSYDAHREETFGVMHPMAPHYNTLLRVDPFDQTGTKPVGDLAESWTISKDGLVYTFKLRQGVKFHDGTPPMTSRDVKASYDKIIFPPAGVASSRKSAYQAVEVVEAPDAQTVRFRLKWPESSFLLNLASPWNWIYKADILAKDMRWYETNVMGTGPFLFVEHVKGSHWVGKKNPDYWDKGKPYLDGYRATFVSSSSAQVAAVRGERAHIQFRGFSPADRDSLVSALGNKITVQESPWDCILMVAMNHEQEALRRQAGAPCPHARAGPLRGIEGALQDRHRQGSGGHPGAGNAVGDAARRARQARGLWARHHGLAGGGQAAPQGGGRRGAVVHVQEPRHPAALRAHRHLAHRPVAPGRASPSSRRSWRPPPTIPCSGAATSRPPWTSSAASSSSPISTCPASCPTPTPTTASPTTRSSTTSSPSRRGPPIPRSARRTCARSRSGCSTRRCTSIMTLQWHRIIPHSSKVKGWTITPSHYLNNMLDTVWLSE